MTCHAKDIASFRRMIASDSDERVVEKLKEWTEFQRSMRDLIPAWRLFCGIYRRGAYERGLWRPTGKEWN